MCSRHRLPAGTFCPHVLPYALYVRALYRSSCVSDIQSSSTTGNMMCLLLNLQPPPPSFRVLSYLTQTPPTFMSYTCMHCLSVHSRLKKRSDICLLLSWVILLHMISVSLFSIICMWMHACMFNVFFDGHQPTSASLVLWGYVNMNVQAFLW